jgi:hypothetical protein
MKGVVSKEGENLILGGPFIVRQRLRLESEARHFNNDAVHIFFLYTPKGRVFRQKELPQSSF